MEIVASRYKRKSKTTQPKYPPPKTIYIDVDGTLLIGGKPNQQVINWARGKYAEGYEIIVWSSRGAANARRAVGITGIQDIVSYMLSKPGYIVDDNGWSWTKYTKQIHDFSK